MHNERKLLSNAETKTELEKERNNRVRESTQFQRSKGPQVNLVPLENRKSPGDEVGPKVPQGGGGGGPLGTRQSFSEVQPLNYFIIYHF